MLVIREHKCFSIDEQTRSRKHIPLRVVWVEAAIEATLAPKLGNKQAVHLHFMSASRISGQLVVDQTHAPNPQAQFFYWDDSPERSYVLPPFLSHQRLLKDICDYRLPTFLHAPNGSLSSPKSLVIHEKSSQSCPAIGTRSPKFVRMSRRSTSPKQ